MIHLKSFKLKKKFRSIKPFELKFRDGLNIIVGENGSGKSSMLYLMTNIKENKELVSLKRVDDNISYIFLDTEKQNPRIKDIEWERDDPAFILLSCFKSHGESMFPIVQSCKSVKNKLVLIDEPEAGISLSNQVKLVKAFNKSVKNGCQLIITTHSYVLIKNSDFVYDLDNKMWKCSKDYIKGLKL